MSLQTYIVRFILLCFVAIAQLLHAQHDPQYGQINLMEANTNPAYAGQQAGIQVLLWHRTQWARFPESPTLQGLNITAPIGIGRSGLGLFLSNEKLGFTTIQTARVGYNYKIRMLQGLLAFGMELGMQNYQANYDQLTIENTDDPILKEYQRNQLFVDLGAGVHYYHQAKGLSLGLAVRRLSLGTLNTQNPFNKNLSMQFGKSINLSTSLNMMLSGQMRFLQLQPNHTTLLCDVHYHSLVWAGLGYRSSQALLINMGLNLNEWVQKLPYETKLAYLVELGRSPLYLPQGPTHEVVLQLNLKKRWHADEIDHLQNINHPVFF